MTRWPFYILKTPRLRRWWATRVRFRFSGYRRVAENLYTLPPNLWAGDSDRGRQLLDDGVYRGGFNESISDGGTTRPFTGFTKIPEDAPADWQAGLHGFVWLRDLAALDDPRAALMARTWVDEWITTHVRWSEMPWRADIMSERICNWLAHAEFLCGSDTPVRKPHDDVTGNPKNEAQDEARRRFKKRLLTSIMMQARVLAYDLPPPGAGWQRLHAIKGLVTVSVALPGRERWQTSALRLLERECTAEVLPDGGHTERNPERLAQALMDLIDLRATLLDAKVAVPDGIQNAIDRMAPMLRALRHPDGGLALFNGGAEGKRSLLDSLLAQTGPVARAPLSAPYAGFQRMEAARTVLILDAGYPPRAGRNSHAGTLSFEMSAGKYRMIVNCGMGKNMDAGWTQSLRATAAHSTLCINDISSTRFDELGRIRQAPLDVRCQRSESEDNDIVVECTHDGYVSEFGMLHHRAIYLANSGDDVRGEDRLERVVPARKNRAGHEESPQTFAIRFHLHPMVHVSLIEDGRGMLLKVGRHDVWRLRVSGGALSLEDSIYLGGQEAKRCQQIVISGPIETADGATALVRWSFARKG